MNINPCLYVEIHPFDGPYSPHPHPIQHGRFDPRYVYKVLGTYNPSETSECYFALANPDRQIWFIPQRHLLAYKLIDSDEFFLDKADLEQRPAGSAGRRGAAEPAVARSRRRTANRATRLAPCRCPAGRCRTGACPCG